MPSLSIVIPCYNAMPYLQKCIGSILEQELSYIDRVEVIVVDDCSTDDSYSYVEEISQRVAEVNRKITFIHIKRESSSGSGTLPRNEGIKQASGDYVFLLDADDYFSPGALDKMVAHAVEWQSDILLCKPVGENGRNVPRSMFKTSTAKADVYTSRVVNKMSNWNLYRRDFLKEKHIVGVYMNPCPADDWDFSLKAYLQADIISVAADYEYLHVIHRDDSNHLTKQLVNRSYTAEQWYTFWNQLFGDLQSYADLTKIYTRIIPRLAGSNMPLRVLTDMFSGNICSEEFLPLISLLKEWFDVDKIRMGGGVIDPEASLIFQAMSTEKISVLHKILEILQTYKEISNFPDKLLLVNSDGINIVITIDNKQYIFNVTQEIKFRVNDIDFQYKNNLFVFSTEIVDYQQYLYRSGRIELLFIDEKNNCRESFVMEKIDSEDRSVYASCEINPYHFANIFTASSIRWDLYINITSNKIEERKIRIGSQGDTDALKETLEQSYIFSPHFCVKGYLTAAKNICFRQYKFPPTTIRQLKCSCISKTNTMCIQGILESLADFQGNEAIFLTLRSSNKKVTLSYMTASKLDGNCLSWSGKLPLQNLLGIVPGKMRWDFYLHIQSPQLGEHLIRLGSQGDLAPLLSSIADSRIVNNNLALTCYLSPAGNICLKQLPVENTRNHTQTRVLQKLKAVRHRVSSLLHIKS